jgi:hypothetical protein
LVPFLTSLLIGGSGLSCRFMALLGLEGGVGSLSGGSGRSGLSAALKVGGEPESSELISQWAPGGSSSSPK